MVICGQELDAADERMARGDVGYPEDEAFDDADDMDSDSSQGSTLKCLQIDLRRFGLGGFNISLSFKEVHELIVFLVLRQARLGESFLASIGGELHQPHV